MTMRLPSLRRPRPEEPPFRTASPGDLVAEGLRYEGVTYRYGDDVVFLGFSDLTRAVEGRAFSVWCGAPHRFALRLDDGRLVELAVRSVAGEEIDYRLLSVRRIAP